MDYKCNMTSKQYQSKRPKRYDVGSCNIHLDKKLSTYYDKICIRSTRAIAQLGRAPRLHARQCFSEESTIQSKESIFLINQCLTPDF